MIENNSTQNPDRVPLLITEEIWDSVDFSTAPLFSAPHPGPCEGDKMLNFYLVVLARRIDAILFSQTGRELYETIKTGYACNLCDNGRLELIDLQTFASFENFTITGAPSDSLKRAWSKSPAAVLDKWYAGVRARRAALQQSDSAAVQRTGKVVS